MTNLPTRTHRNHPIILMSSIFTFGILAANQTFAQPYIDLFSIRYTSSPDFGKVGDSKNPTQLDYLNISTAVPIQFKNKQDLIVLSPFFERWSSQVQTINNYKRYHYGLALPVTIIKSIPHSTWSIATTAIWRLNDAAINKSGEFQFGGFMLASKRIKENLVYKFGVYVNAEFFGLFVIPLLGIDWQINERTNLFGVLPASLTLEYKLAKHWYTGGVFRTFTNSYHDSGSNYFRVDENQLGVFLDYYPCKKILLNFETGHSILRQLRSGEWHQVNDNWDADNNIYFRIGVAYRFRLRG